MPTNDTYLENGTDIGLTVDNFILSYVNKTVNIPVKIGITFVLGK